MPAQFILRESNVQQVVRELKGVEGGLYKQLRADLRETLKPTLVELQARIPSQAPLSGFSRNKATGPEALRYTWAKPNAKVITDLGNPKQAAGGQIPLVSLNFKDAKNTAGFTILELAGSKNIGRFKRGLAPQGRAMIDALNQRYPQRSSSGRFVLPYARPQRPRMVAAVTEIIVRYAEKIGKRLR